MGVPVVRPSNTPERMRTWSPSRRWLTKCEVPVRRRSTSCCRSASLNSSPGGQPSTMHPSAGPWLSPKVVTVKSLPILLPDMVLPSVRRELFAREEEHPSPAALELKPQEGQAREGAPQRALGVAHFHHQQSPGAQVPCRLAQYHAYRVEAAAPGGERHARFVPVLRRQAAQLACPYVGRVRHDDIVAAAPEGAEVI